MNCEEVHDKLHPFLDGELTAAEASAVEQALVDCPDCQSELAEMQAVRALAREAFEAADARVAEVDLSGLFDGVMARLEADGAIHTRSQEQAAAPAAPAAPAAEPQPDFIDRAMDWLGKALRFEQPMASFALAAAIALIVGGVYWAQTSAVETAPGGSITSTPSIANGDPAPRPRRGMELEHRNVAEVESVEVAVGRVEIDDVTADPDKPMVVWHIVDEGATGSAEQGL